MVLYILLCAFCTVALLAAVWLLAALFLLPVRDNDAYMLLLASGDGARLEQQCRAYLLLCGIGAIRRPLLIVDQSLTKEGRAAAKLLAQDHAQIRLCSLAEFEEILHTEK